MESVEDIVKAAVALAKASSSFDGVDIGSDCQLGSDSIDWDRSTLIDAAASLLWGQLGGIIDGGVLVDRVWLERTVAQKVANRVMQEGYLEWTLHLGNAGSRVTKCVTLTYPVRNGKLEEAQYFRIPSGSLMPLTKASLMNYLVVGKRPGY